MPQDKRKFPRAKYPCCLTLLQGNGYGTITADTINIGAGGVLVRLKESLMIGAKVEIKIDFSEGNSLQCSGLILRCQQKREEDDENEEGFSTAIVFEGLDEEKVSCLKEAIHKILISESGN